MSSNDKFTDKPTHSAPIPITARNRARSLSVSSASSGSASSIPTTPASPTSDQRINIPSPSTSPILSYFLAQSPTKTPGTTTTFPFKRKFGTAPVFEVDEETEKEIPVAAHARRASATVANRFSQNPTAPLSDAHSERGTNLLRRLSLSSSAFIKPPFDATRIVTPPSPPPNTAVSPTPKNVPFSNKPHRSATISTDGGKPRRAPSPMGERILKGHFDGFN
ncbi:hypothetical protein BYT27DRAFT_7226396 [Phlegmacium glaucopus]|nr:hypothetical protein BYT27DRAFT_7226396 [Phlegmacium glaucopus]